MLFTFNADFDFDEKMGGNQGKGRCCAHALMREYGISTSRVVAVPRVTGKYSKYVRESPWMVKTFFSLHSDHLTQSDVFFHDEGGCFMEAGFSVLATLGYFNEYTYPPSVHMYLSPNDNKFHGAAKRAWRKSGVDMKDDVASSLRLMFEFDCIKSKSIRSWWKYNFNLNNKCVLRERMEDLVRGRRKNLVERSEYYQKCMEHYRRSVLEPAKRGNIHYIEKPLSFENTFDSTYWTTFMPNK